jgi:anti-sigma factor RsiW
MRRNPMKCQTARKRISEYIDGELNAAQKVSLEEHCAQCADCQKLMKDHEQSERAGSAFASREHLGKDPGKNTLSRTGGLDSPPTKAALVQIAETELCSQRRAFTRCCCRPRIHLWAKVLVRPGSCPRAGQPAIHAGKA